MTASQPCPKCGAPIPPDARWGMCPKCLLDPDSAMAPETPEAFKTSFGALGRRFGNYDLGPQIGRGGMGVVYEAVQLRAQRRVAVKMIIDSHATSPAARRRFAIEAEAAAKLDHPNIVPIYEVGEQDEQPFLSMKLVDGQSLRHKLSERECGVPGKSGDTTRLALRERQAAVARLMATVARAVHHAHQKGVLHRDLKPGNIIIDREGRPHLTDFGLAKILDAEDGDGAPASGTHSSAILGTPSYMSPEQASNQRLTAASDTYSLGTILYEMLTGQPPFKGNTLLDTIRQVIEQPPRRPRVLHPEIDSDLETICLKCLEKAPEARYSSSLALAEDLERWLKQEPILARRSGPVSRLRRWVKRNPVGASLIVSLCACLMVSLAFLRLARRQAWERELAVALSQDEFERQVNQLWESEDRKDVAISAARLATLAGLEPRGLPPTNAISLVFARTISEAPISQATRYAPFLRLLEGKMADQLRQPVFFDLLLCKDRSWADSAVRRGDAHFQSFSPLTYVRLKQTTPGLQPIGWWGRAEDEAVLFAAKQSGITNISQVSGHRAVFAHTNAFVSFLAKVHLVRAGICESNFKVCLNLNRSVTREAPAQKGESTGDLDDNSENEDYAHREVIQRVLAGEFEVGVATRRRFDVHKTRGQGLVELHAFSIMPNVLVAGANLDPGVVAAFQKCMSGSVTARDLALLNKFKKTSAGGLDPVNDREFDELRAMLINELRVFESGRPSAPATNAPASPVR